MRVIFNRKIVAGCLIIFSLKKFEQMIELLHKQKLRVQNVKNQHAPSARGVFSFTSAEVSVCDPTGNRTRITSLKS